MMKGKNILLGVTGSIAAYKAAALASLLMKQGCHVDVIMTENATQFISPVTFESLTGTKCMVDTFDRNFKFDITHISLAKKADAVVIAPASANIIGKMAGGIADDMLSTTWLACRCAIIVAPAMNTRMYEHPVVQKNMQTLKELGCIFAEPAEGLLACGDVGKGKMMEPADILPYIERAIMLPHDMEGMRVMVTAGPTQESIDPVRYITNHSSGKMGYAMAKMAMLRGAQVLLITGQTALTPPPFVEVVDVTSAEDMFQAVAWHASEADIIIKAAAVADYTPTEPSTEKIKKQEGSLSIPLRRTTDILAWLGEHRKKGQFLCGFSMETQNMVENSRKKLEKKKIDMVAANNLKVEGAGFGTDTNVMTLITSDDICDLPMMSKEETANTILDHILERMKKKK